MKIILGQLAPRTAIAVAMHWDRTAFVADAWLDAEQMFLVDGVRLQPPSKGVAHSAAQPLSMPITVADCFWSEGVVGVDRGATGTTVIGMRNFGEFLPTSPGGIPVAAGLPSPCAGRDLYGDDVLDNGATAFDIDDDGVFGISIYERNDRRSIPAVCNLAFMAALPPQEGAMGPRATAR